MLASKFMEFVWNGMYYGKCNIILGSEMMSELLVTEEL
jgi:hypothetical protein